MGYIGIMEKKPESIILGLRFGGWGFRAKGLGFRARA